MKIEKFQLCGNNSLGAGAFQLLRGRAPAQIRGKIVVGPTHQPPLLPGKRPGTHFCYNVGRLQRHSAGGRIKSMKNHSDSTGNLNPPACSAVSQLATPPRASL
jgi:hypothetical protein